MSSTADMSQLVNMTSLQSAGIIPDVLPASYADASVSLVSLPMTYEESGVSVSSGNTLTCTASNTSPQFSLPPDVPSDGLYCILGFDPDGPSRRKPRMRNILHLMQINIPSSASDIQNAGTTHFAYAPPGPPRDSGKHRYVFLLYRQSGAIDATKLPTYDGISGRCNLRVEEVEERLSEAGGGNMKLVAVNWFEAEWDEQVDRDMDAKFGWKAIPLRWLLWVLK